MLRNVYENYVKLHNFNYSQIQFELSILLERFIIKPLFRSGNINGVYIYGSVGRGKTMMMNLFFENCKVKNKKRFHMSELMQCINQMINEAKIMGYQDPVKYVIKKFLRYNILCIDEFEILDVVTSVIIRRVLNSMLGAGKYLIITSNTMPINLYKDGLQRDKFLELINNISNKMQVFYLDEDKDYRDLKVNNLIFYKDIFDTSAECEMSLYKTVLPRLNVTLYNKCITINSRKVNIQYFNNIIIVDFKQFCDGNFSYHDYIEVFNIFSKVIVFNIPNFDKNNISALKRFIWLIDIIYDNRVGFMGLYLFDYNTYDCSSLQGLYPEILRTFSRIREMNAISQMNFQDKLF